MLFLLYIFNSAFLYLQVRTLFVSGLPMDTKPRELYLLFRAYEVGGQLLCEVGGQLLYEVGGQLLDEGGWTIIR